MLKTSLSLQLQGMGQPLFVERHCRDMLSGESRRDGRLPNILEHMPPHFWPQDLELPLAVEGHCLDMLSGDCRRDGRLPEILEHMPPHLGLEDLELPMAVERHCRDMPQDLELPLAAVQHYQYMLSGESRRAVRLPGICEDMPPHLWLQDVLRPPQLERFVRCQTFLYHRTVQSERALVELEERRVEAHRSAAGAEEEIRSRGGTIRDSTSMPNQFLVHRSAGYPMHTASHTCSSKPSQHRCDYDTVYSIPWLPLVDGRQGSHQW